MREAIMHISRGKYTFCGRKLPSERTTRFGKSATCRTCLRLLGAGQRRTREGYAVPTKARAFDRIVKEAQTVLGSGDAREFVRRVARYSTVTGRRGKK